MKELVWFFDGWPGVGRVVTVAVCGYLLLLTLVRISGKRLLSKMSAFDFIITISIGSAFARVITAKSTALVEALAAFVTLVGLQFLVAWSAARWPRAGRWVKHRPTILFVDGHLREDVLLRERVTGEEVDAAVRKAGLGSLELVEAVVLETDGTIAVIPASKAGDRSSFLPLPSSAAEGRETR